MDNCRDRITERQIKTSWSTNRTQQWKDRQHASRQKGVQHTKKHPVVEMKDKSNEGPNNLRTKDRQTKEVQTSDRLEAS